MELGKGSSNKAQTLHTMVHVGCECYVELVGPGDDSICPTRHYTALRRLRDAPGSAELQPPATQRQKSSADKQRMALFTLRRMGRTKINVATKAGSFMGGALC